MLAVADQQHSVVNVQGSVALRVNGDDQGALAIGGDFHMPVVNAVSVSVCDLNVVRALDLRQGPVERQQHLVRRFGNCGAALRFFLNQILARAGRGCHRQPCQEGDCANHGQHGAKEAGASAHRMSPTLILRMDRVGDKLCGTLCGMSASQIAGSSRHAVRDAGEDLVGNGVQPAGDVPGAD